MLTRGDKFQNALIGAAIGGIAGGAIGNYQDRQEQQLRASMAGSGVSVVRQGNNITLAMPGHITFATNSATDSGRRGHPIASNATAAGRQQNRRVELTVVPVEKKS